MSRIVRLLDEQERRLGEQERVLLEQQRQIVEQRAMIDRQRAELASLTSVSDRVSDSELGEMRAAGAGQPAFQVDFSDPGLPVYNRGRALRRMQDGSQSGGGGLAPVQPPGQPLSQQNQGSVVGSRPAQPVGEAPPEQAPRRIEAVPEEVSVLTAPGRLNLDVSVDYTHASSNRLVFRGVEIVTGIQVGLIEANEASRDTISGSISARYGLAPKWELEARVPYMARWDRVKTLAQRDETVSRTLELEGSDIGDVELGLRYQLNNGARDGAIFVAGVRVKSDTGAGPFDIARDEFGVAKTLATGSGFWSVQGSVSAMIPSDPVVLFANAAYSYSMARDINKEIGGAMIGEVDPGDSISVGGGFGFSLNPNFSYSMGYSHTYVMETESEIGDTHQRSTSLQVGTLQFGFSYRFNEERSLNVGFDFGVTDEAPDVRVSFRTPLRF